MTVPINPNVFDANVEKLPIRKGFGDGLLVLGEKDHRVVGLCADLTESTMMHLFKNKFPDRFVEMGIMEQSMASVASGMAAMGKIPFFASYAMFSPGRNWEQIRTTICYNHVNAKIVGAHAGISVGPDGGTHQAIEDIAIMRIIPRMVVIAPCDAIEAKKATIAAGEYDGPVYIRLAREGTPIVTCDDTPFAIGKAEIFFAPLNQPAQVGIIATGSLVHNALLAAKQLTDAGVPTKLLNLPTIKPLDEGAILDLARETNAIVTVEEHQQHGGMGSAVAEYLSQVLPTKMAFVGVNDQFGQSGTPDELVEHYGMGVDEIVKKARALISR